MMKQLRRAITLLVFTSALSLVGCSSNSHKISAADDSLFTASDSQLVTLLSTELSKANPDQAAVSRVQERLLQVNTSYRGFTESPQRLKERFEFLIEEQMRRNSEGEAAVAANHIARIKAAQSEFKSPKRKLSVEQLSISKREFETEEQFARRKAQATGDFRFSVEREFTAESYDIDRQTIFVTLRERAHCESASARDKISCPRLVSFLVKDDAKYSEYLGTNAFGASRKITKANGFQTFVGVKVPSPLKDADAGKIEFKAPLSYGEIAAQFSMPPEVARRFREGRARVGARFSFLPCPSGEDCSISHFLKVTPTISSPSDLHILEIIHQLRLESVVFFEKGTGRILATFVE